MEGGGGGRGEEMTRSKQDAPVETSTTSTGDAMYNLTILDTTTITSPERWFVYGVL